MSGSLNDVKNHTDLKRRLLTTDNILLDLHNSSYHTQRHSVIIANYYYKTKSVFTLWLANLHVLGP